MDNVLQVLVVVFMALVVLMQIVVMMRISRVERLLRSSRSSKPEESVSIAPQRVVTPGKSHGQGLFDQYLAEDPKRRLFTKRESSEAFRAWRKEHGMTWQKTETEEDDEA